MIETINVVVNICMLLITTLGGVFGFKAYFASKKDTRYQIIANLFEEYSSDQMGESVKYLWDFWRSCGGSDDSFRNEDVRSKLVKKYMSKYNKKDNASIHIHRRRVSNFYQQFAVASLNNKEIQKIFYTVWSKRDLEIIPEIIEPIEMLGIQKSINGKSIANRHEYPRYMQQMCLLYDNATS
jgi:hypothetical protein